MSRKIGMLASLLLIICINTFAEEMNAEILVKKSFDYWRGQASEAVLKIIIHRPDWERVMKIKAWTKGEKDSLFVITYPPKDEGNGTLKKGLQMWMYNPKVNRIMKLPPSMMSQSWYGSDFSNNDLTKADSLLIDYTHTLIETREHDGKELYVIESIPKPHAPVV